MPERLLLAWLLGLVLAFGCAADSSVRAGDGVIAQRLQQIFEGGEPAMARDRAADLGAVVDDHGVVVDIQTRGLTAGDRASFVLPGVRVRHFAPEYERVSASVRDRTALQALAALEPVRRIAPEYGGTTRSGGAAY